MGRRGSQNTSTAVMARKAKVDDDDLFGRLEFFPTPPWATRALCEAVLPLVWGRTDLSDCSVAEPAAGQGHMAEVLREYFGKVFPSDVHDYGRGYRVGSYTGKGPDVLPAQRSNWVISNPPFSLAAEFAERALREASDGIALLVRMQWLETADRWREIFKPSPPSLVAQFVERVPMEKGRWNPKGASATAYCWVVWCDGTEPQPFFWIPPGQRQRLTRPDDVARFGERRADAGAALLAPC